MRNILVFSCTAAMTASLFACGPKKELSSRNETQQNLNDDEIVKAIPPRSSHQDESDSEYSESNAAAVAGPGMLAELSLFQTPTEKRDCILDSEANAVITRKFQGTDSSGTEYLPVENGDLSTRVETFSKGEFFGTSTPEAPNTGFTGRFGNPTNGAPTVNQPKNILCSKKATVLLGWKFSSNVAGLKQRIDINTNVKKENQGNNTVTLRTEGHLNITYHNPASVAPVSSTPSLAYFDASADNGVGVFSLSRAVEIGSKDHPSSVQLLIRNGDGESLKDTDAKVYTVEPLQETLVRSMNQTAPGTPAKKKGWTLVSKQIKTGKILTVHSSGTKVATTVDSLVYGRDSNDDLSCTPVSGTLTDTITPVEGGTQIRVTRRFGETIGVNDQISISCYADSERINCAGNPLAALQKLSSSLCLY